jgi:hypothetical protein
LRARLRRERQVTAAYGGKFLIGESDVNRVTAPFSTTNT